MSDCSLSVCFCFFSLLSANMSRKSFQWSSTQSYEAYNQARREIPSHMFHTLVGCLEPEELSSQPCGALSAVDSHYCFRSSNLIPLEGSLKFHLLILTLTFNYSHLQIFTQPPRSFPQNRQEALCSASVHHQAVLRALLFTDPLRSPTPPWLMTLKLGVIWLPDPVLER